jgi:hypothetical protein
MTPGVSKSLTRSEAGQIGPLSMGFGFSAEVSELQNIVRENIEGSRETLQNLISRIENAQTVACSSEDGGVSKADVEILTLKPTIYGIGIDLKEAGRWLRRRFTKKP